MTPDQMRKTLTEALKDKQPTQFAQMKEAGTLPTYLDSLISLMMESMNEARHQAISEATTEGRPGYVENPLLRQQTLNSQFKAAEEVALSQAIEQIDNL